MTDSRGPRSVPAAAAPSPAPRPAPGLFKGAFTILTIAGVPVRIHWTFLILLAWVFGAGALGRGGSVHQGLVSLAFVAAIFACVVAHEFGHILAARSFGVRTRDVTLLPIGRVAALERIPDKPWQELLVAVAGPLVNIVIALALLPGLLLPRDLADLAAISQPGDSPRSFVASVAAVNIWLVLFNLIPAFPMDGGRVLRALVAMVTDRLRATRIAAGIGQVIAVAMALLGIVAGMPMLLILALFVFLGAGAEAAGVEAGERLRGLRIADVMVRSFRTLSESESLGAAVTELLSTSQIDFPVTPDGGPRAPVVGLLTRVDLVRALAELGPSVHVARAMRPACPALHPAQPAQAAVDALRDADCPLIPVVDAGALVGIVTAENLSEVILIRGALDHPRPR